MVGEKVLVRLDPSNLGKAFCFSSDGAQFLGEAINPELVGIDRAAVVAATRAEQARILRDKVAEARAQSRKIKPRDVIDGVLRVSAAKAGKLVEFPTPSAPHSTPQLSAAAAVGRTPSAPASTPEFEARRAEMVAKFKAGSAKGQVLPLPKPKAGADPVGEMKARYRRFLALSAAEADGEPISEEDHRFIAAYPSTSEFRTVTQQIAHFGAEAILGRRVERRQREAGSKPPQQEGS